MPQQCKLREDIIVDGDLYYYTSYTTLRGTTIMFQNANTNEVFRWFDENLKPKNRIKFKPEFVESVIIRHNEEERC